MSCHHNSPPIYLPPAPTELTRAAGIPEPDHSGVDHVDTDAGVAWRRVITEARSVSARPEFASALTHFAKMDPKVGAPITSGGAVLVAYSGASATLGQVMTQYVLTATSCEDAHQTASTLIVDATPKGPTHGWYARVTLNPCTLKRARSPSTGEFACAVNTAAHEWTHAVLKGNDQLYQDKGHKDDANPVVSYTVGAIAQCVFLATRTPPMISSTKIDECVSKVGPHSFDPRTCNDGWSVQFRNPTTR